MLTTPVSSVAVKHESPLCFYGVHRNFQLLPHAETCGGSLVLSVVNGELRSSFRQHVRSSWRQQSLHFTRPRTEWKVSVLWLLNVCKNGTLCRRSRQGGAVGRLCIVSACNEFGLPYGVLPSVFIITNKSTANITKVYNTKVTVDISYALTCFDIFMSSSCSSTFASC
jgi:hypothetical protein